MSAWTCSVCTYAHASAEERGFLSCAMCGAPREQQPGGGSSSKWGGGWSRWNIGA